MRTLAQSAGSQLVNVIGWYGQQNIGDESYKLCFEKLFPDEQFEFTDKVTQEFAILGGGNVCSNKFIDVLEKAKRKIAFSVGCIPSDPLERMSIFDEIYVRDQNSLALLDGKGIKAKLIPDLAFILSPDVNNGKSILKRLFKQKDFYTKVVGVVINSYVCLGEGRLARDEATFQSVSWDLARIMDNTSASFVFIPFGQKQPFDDRITNAWVAGKCKYWNKNVVVYEALSVQDTLDLVSACDCLISSRLHSSIFSTIADIPFVDITHHSKNSSYLKSIHKEDWSVSYWDFDRSKLKSLLQTFLYETKDYGLDKIVTENRLSLGKQAKCILPKRTTL